MVNSRHQQHAIDGSANRRHKPTPCWFFHPCPKRPQSEAGVLSENPERTQTTAAWSRSLKNPVMNRLKIFIAVESPSPLPGGWSNAQQKKTAPRWRLSRIWIRWWDSLDGVPAPVHHGSSGSQGHHASSTVQWSGEKQWKNKVFFQLWPMHAL
jgi:hypothetical protein